MRTSGVETLDRIVEHKLGEIEAARAARPLDEVRRAASDADPPRAFYEAVATPPAGLDFAVIAEVKRRSPSAGWIREDAVPDYDYESTGRVDPDRDGFDPAGVAAAYASHGAAAISCLTDERFFAGHLSYVQRVREAIALPVLRKDFIIDAYQVHEARAADADAVLLIAECLENDAIVELLGVSESLGMSTLIEVHSVENLDRVRALVPDPASRRALLGINNRDLTTMTTDVRHAVRMVESIGAGEEAGQGVVAESGIRTRADLDVLAAAGVRAVLVGESLMRETDPGAARSALLGGAA